MPIRCVLALTLAMILPLRAQDDANQTAAPPYFTMDTVEQAKALAQQKHLPLAWLSTERGYIKGGDGEDAELTHLAFSALRDRAIIIFVNNNADMGRVPGNVHHQGFSAKDDGVIPGGGSYIMPKIIFSSPDVKVLLGRVSHTQMKERAARPSMPRSTASPTIPPRKPPCRESRRNRPPMRQPRRPRRHLPARRPSRQSRPRLQTPPRRACSTSREARWRRLGCPG